MYMGYKFHTEKSAICVCVVCSLMYFFKDLEGLVSALG